MQTEVRGAVVTQPGTDLIRRNIGRRVKAAREAGGLSQDAVATTAELGRSTIVRIEQGDPRVRFRERDFAAVLDACRVSGPEREALLGLSKQVQASHRQKSWWHDYTGEPLPQSFFLYLTLEDAATHLRSYEADMVPALLQTRGYAELMLEVATRPLHPHSARRQLEARLRRQALLTRPQAPELEFVIGEGALARLAHIDRRLAGEQVRHLMEMAQLPNVAIRVLPWSAGLHPGMSLPVGFLMMEFPIDPATCAPFEPPIAFAEPSTGLTYWSSPEEMETYRRVWAAVLATTHDGTRSHRVLQSTLDGLG